MGDRLARWTIPLAFGFVVAMLVVPSLTGGVWDPHEVRSLEFARRIALGLLGAKDLALPGAENDLPSRGEVDRGELPFTSMALAVRLFGLHAWAARLALLVWALAGLAAIYGCVRRLADRRAAAFSVLALGTMPLYFLHARTLLGDGVTMSALAIAVAGLLLALHDRASVGARLVFLAFGTAGLVAGALCRGLLLGVAVPVLGVALAWLVQRVTGALRPDPLAALLGPFLLAVGLVAGAAGTFVFALAQSDPERYFALLGFGIVRGTTRPTFDALIAQLGHGLFPWSALLPLALGRALLLPPHLEPEAREREAALRLAAVVTATLGFGAWAWVADSASLLPFGPVAVLAVVAALMLRDIDSGAPASATASILAVALLALFVLDFQNGPEQTLRAFAVEAVRFPDSYRVRGLPWLFGAAAIAAVCVFVGLFEADEPDARAFVRDDYAGWLRTVRDLWNGNLLFGACVVEAALLGFLAFDLLGERIPAFERFAAANELTKLVGRTAWLAVPLLFALPLLALLLRDSLRWLALRRSAHGFGRLIPPRGTIALFGFVAGGSALGVGYYPALAAQLSPQEAFDAFRAAARPGDEIGVVGADGAAAFYSLGRNTRAFETSEQGYEWLVAAESRRFLVLRADALAGLNSRYRGRKQPAVNLPILSVRSSEILLASNRLESGERNQNPLERFLLAELPDIGRPLDANLGDQLEVHGWDVTDLEGNSVRSVSPGRRYEFVIYFEATARVAGAWETFVHIDGFQRRFNGDHPTLEGLYPFSLWRIGDLVADRHTFVLEPNFTAGEYRVYFGLYSGSRRMPVRRGTHSDDRLDAGPLRVD